MTQRIKYVLLYYILYILIKHYILSYYYYCASKFRPAIDLHKAAASVITE